MLSRLKTFPASIAITLTQGCHFIINRTQTDRNSFKAFSRFFRKKAFFCRAIYDFFLKTLNKPLLSLVKSQKMWYNIFCSIVFS